MDNDIKNKNNYHNDLKQDFDSKNWCENYSKARLKILFELEVKNQTDKIILNQKTNQKIYEDLVDKVHYKAIDLNILNTLLQDKLKKLNDKQNKKIDKLNYQYKNYLISQQDFETKLNLLTSSFKIKWDAKSNKYTNKKNKFEKDFGVYTLNISNYLKVKYEYIIKK